MTITNQTEIDSHEHPLRPDFRRHLSWTTPFSWLKLGLRDTLISPSISFVYGFIVFVISVLVIGGQAYLKFDYILLPLLAGFMVIGPALALGLYEKSRRIALGKSLSLGEVLFVRTKSRRQILFIGVMLMMLMMLWLRAAFLLYALFFGKIPFAGFDHIPEAIVTTPEGWGLLVVGSLVGGLFAAFSFSISAFSIPMLLNEKKDAFTAMAISMAMAWSNKRIAIVWGAIVLALFIISLMTAMIGLIFIFPILGHATWHAYVEMRGDFAKRELVTKS
jgi:uncharacterized membrane protein